MIATGGYRGNRHKILAATGITTSALSQYLGGQSKPSFPTLVALAEFFDVTLDYLVFGEHVDEVITPDFGPLARYMDVSLRGIEQRIQQHSAIVARIGSILSTKIDQAVSEAVHAEHPRIPSLLSEDDAMLIESYSLETRLILLDLWNDIIVLPEDQDDAMGRFLPLVAKNINTSRCYKFLLPNRILADWRNIAGRLRKLLRTQCSTDSVNKYCEIRLTDAPIFSGLAIYQLNVPQLQSAEPAFYELVKGFIDQDGWAGNTVSPNGHTYESGMFDELHLANARKQFDYLWKRGTPI